MKRKPGPKPKPDAERAVRRNYSYTAEHGAFLDGLDAPGAFIRKLIDNSKEFQKRT